MAKATLLVVGSLMVMVSCQRTLTLAATPVPPPSTASPPASTLAPSIITMLALTAPRARSGAAAVLPRPAYPRR